MTPAPEKSAPTTYISADRLWAEQLAVGMALLIGLLIFMAMFHPKLLSSGAAVLGPNDLDVYGWASLVGVILQVVVHEAGTLVTAWYLGLPLRFRFFGFGANATAILESQLRRPWTDAVVGFAGPLTGSVVSIILAGLYFITYSPDELHPYGPFFLGMACVGYFYNLFTLIPILDLEGGWIAPAISPVAWLLGLATSAMALTNQFNLVLLCIVVFGVPRLVQIITARTPQLDTACTTRQRFIISIGYFILVIALASLGSTTFDKLPGLIGEAMGD
jgi:Zn-dependent protease